MGATAGGQGRGELAAPCSTSSAAVLPPTRRASVRVRCATLKLDVALDDVLGERIYHVTGGQRVIQASGLESRRGLGGRKGACCVQAARAGVACQGGR